MWRMGLLPRQSQLLQTPLSKYPPSLFIRGIDICDDSVLCAFKIAGDINFAGRLAIHIIIKIQCTW